MEQNPERVTRPVVPELDEVLGHPFKVLDDGFVRVVDYMGSDSSIVQAARVSYGTGTKRVHEDRGLIRYLLRHWHTTPFEMADIKFHVRVPMDCWRQWIRHRTACLAEGTEVYFDLPGGVARRGNQLYKLKIEEIWDRFQPTRNATRPDKQKNPHFRRDRVRKMRLRQVDEDTGRIQHTRIVDVYDNGPKPVFRMTLADGKTIECTSDHKFFFDDGWHTLKQGTGLEEQGGRAVWDEGERYLYVNGAMVAAQEFYGEEVSPALVEQGPVEVAKLVRIAAFEYVGIKRTFDLEVEGPHHNFVANGIVTHNSVNEYSTRYSIAIDAAQTTPVGEWREQAAGNRQGSEGFLSEAVGAQMTEREAHLQSLSREIYEERIEAGVAREQARKDLPLSTYTESYWKTNLHNLLHFLRLRMDDHAQLEIREYARVIGEEIVARWTPIAWQAFLDYRFHSTGLTRLEHEVLRAATAGDIARGKQLAESYGWMDRKDDGTLKRNRERAEAEEKLADLGVAIPWKE